MYSANADKYYVGHTSDMERRLNEHNSNQTRYTSQTAKGWKVVYTEHFGSRSEAMKREREIKSKKSRKYIEVLIGGGAG
ncbi:MAG: GIY-YIG nuclease family protein [Chitinophagales bacterium]|nr:GIY-YIG nuclease family protein [Chitinophagales bacterium]HRP39223.1 GIY-YIG nuclease family protein [Chitinophagales bacterium]